MDHNLFSKGDLLGRVQNYTWNCYTLKFFRHAFLINWITFALTRSGRQLILESGIVTMSTADSLCVVCSGAEEGRLFVSGHLLQLLRPLQEYWCARVTEQTKVFKSHIITCASVCCDFEVWARFFKFFC